MKWSDILLCFGLFLISVIVNSCKKDPVPSSQNKTMPAFISNYIIEIDNNYRIYKVSFSRDVISANYIKEYVYSEGKIQETVTFSTNKSVVVYFINDHGLADSSHYTYSINNHLTGDRSSSYFVYDSNNYLKLRINKRTDQTGQKPDTTFYVITNGNIVKIRYSNRVFGITFPTSYTYTYNSKKNFIDIDTYTGEFLGTLNQNLKESVVEYGNPEGNVKRLYKYLFDSNGLVVERTQTCSTRADLIDRFEYIIK